MRSGSYKKNQKTYKYGVKRSKKASLTRQKKVNRRRNTRVIKKAKVFTYAIFTVLLTSLLLFAISVYKFMNAPFSSAAYTDYDDTQKVWRDDQTTLLLMQVSDIDDKYTKILNLALISFDNNLKRYYIYQIPTDVEVDYALNFGKGTFENMYAAGNTDQGRGLYLSEKNILKTFAVKIDGYVITDSKGFEEMSDIVGGINPKDLSSVLRIKNYTKMPALLGSFRENTITNLKLGDIKEIISFIRDTSETSSSYIKLNKYHILESSRWDYIWQEDHQISEISKEAVKVFIGNASDPQVAGLASWGSRIVENLGISVFEADNSKTSFTQNTIIAKDIDLLSVQKIAETLHIKDIQSVEDIPQSEREKYNPQVFRADISLFLTRY